MANPDYPATTLAMATPLTILNSNVLHEVVNGEDYETVTVDDGEQINTVRKTLRHINEAADIQATDIQLTADNQLISIGSAASSQLNTIQSDADNILNNFTYAVGWNIVADFAIGETVVNANDVLRYQASLYRPLGTLPWTTDGATPSTDSRNWVAVANGETQNIARALNILDSAVLDAADSFTQLEFIKVIYDSSVAQKGWYKPDNVGNTETVVSVVGNVLTTNVTTYRMRQVVTKTINFTKPNVSLPFDSNIVEKLNGSLSFTRLSETGNVNASGVSETLGVDEPAITKDGLSVFGEFINEIEYSEDVSNPAWVKGANVSVLPDDSTENGYSFDKMTISDVTNILTRSSNLSVTAGDTVYYTALVSIASNCEAITVTFQGGVLSGWQAGAVNFDGQLDPSTGGNWSLISFEQISGNVYKLQCSVLVDVAANMAISINPSLQNGGVQSGDSLLIASSSVVKNVKNAPYIKTTTAPATRGPEIVSFQTMKNMPAAGQPFTIECVCDVPLEGRHAAWSVNGVNFTLWRFNAGDNISLRDAGLIIPSSATIGEKRYIVTFDGSTASVYVDGILYDKGLYTPTYDPLVDVIRIGQANPSGPNTATLGSSIRAVKLYDVALPAEEVAVLGGPEA